MKFSATRETAAPGACGSRLGTSAQVVPFAGHSAGIECRAYARKLWKTDNGRFDT